MPSDSRRPRRVAEAIRSTVAEALTSTLSDPVLAGVVITEVTVSDDLCQARIRVRRLVDDGRPESRKRLVERLAHAQGRLRKLLGPRLDLRRVPELHFVFDEGPDARNRVDELLREIAREKKNEPGDS
ncbi:MAG: 30S ribosome-binding factor RbfA [Polyangiaceae bacterium]